MMRNKARIFYMVLVLVLMIGGCGKNKTDNTDHSDKTEATDVGDDSVTFGSSLDDLNAYAGYFEEDIVDVTVTCVSGTEGCYTLQGNVLTFTNLSEDSVYSVSGKLRGNIVIDVGDDYKLDLEMQGLSVVCNTTNPITVLSGNEVSLTAKSEYQNYIYDTRTAVSDDDETVYSGAVYSKVDLEVCGKGSLTLVSENNNGIHSKDDLQVKNLTLLVACMDNALKGNDSVEIEEGTLTLIATQGDAIKTTNSDVSDKGNQRGTVTVVGGTHTIYAACDGIDAAYDVAIEGDSTNLSIYTDKYSNYSTEVTAVSDSEYYIRFTNNGYQYSVKYYNSDKDYKWVNAEYHSAASGSRTNYYYYSFPKLNEYSKIQLFIYASSQKQGQEEEYLAATDYLSLNSGYDTIALSIGRSNMLCEWTNYTTTVQENNMGGRGGFGGHGGLGGMNGGNSDKGNYSTKGIKAANEIQIHAGNITIKAYDDAIHANNDTSLENGKTPTGNVTISGGTVTAYSNDDGIHADGALKISGGAVYVTNSYEGLEGTEVAISGGNVSVKSSDDGINGTATSGTAISISNGNLYVYAGGDGIDSNSRSSYSGIVFSGGKTVVISTSSGNSAIDTEQGYQYTGGSVVAVMPQGGMSNEVTHCSNFSSIGTYKSVSFSSGNCVTVTSGSKTIVTVQMPSNISGLVVYLGDSAATISAESSTSATLDSNGVCWK